MTFLAPELLLGLLLIPVAIGFYIWTQRRRTRYAVRFTNLDLLANIAPRRPAWRRHVPPALYLGAIAALLLGLARPTMVVPVPREDATVLLAMDVSGSMRASDVSPTRLDAAKAAALSFIDQLPEGIRVGVVSFASNPNTVIAPTTDRVATAAAIEGLAAKDGTAMGDALMQVLDIAESIQAGEGTTRNAAPDPSAGPEASPAPSAPVDQPSNQPLVAAILLSDGANSVGTAEPLDAAARAETLGVPIYTIALGTPGGKIEVTDRFGQPVTLDVPPDTKTLQQIADITGGEAFDAPSAVDLQAVYAGLESRVGYIEQTQEVTVVLVAAGLILVVIGAGAAALWFGRLP